ncbi:MAG: hypothetical protein U1A77_19520 [Pirellulales bacterium]
MSSLLCLFTLVVAFEPPIPPVHGVDRVARQRSAMESHLKQVGIEPTSLGARRFLAGFAPAGTATRRLDLLLESLGAADFSQRETATQRLSEEPYVPEPWLRRAAASADPEVQWRASQVIAKAGVRHSQTLRAVCVIAWGPAASSLASSPLAPAPEPVPAPSDRAVPATPTVDEPLASENAEVLVESLVRESTDSSLIAFVRQQFPSGRRESKKSPQPQLRSLPWLAIYDRATLGEHTLVATGTRGVTLEIDAAGVTRWRLPYRAWSAERRSNGLTLLASLDEQRIVEVDTAGQVLWMHSLAATRAKPLAGGRVLAVDYPAGQVVELLRDQSVAWRYQAPDPCFDAERLPSGHTLVACANLVQEVSPLGEVVWQWQVRGRLNGLQALASGHLLVANYGANEVAELDDAGAVVWKISEPQPSDAFRLPSGHTLVTTAQRVVEFDSGGKEVRVLTTAKYGSARR